MEYVQQSSLKTTISWEAERSQKIRWVTYNYITWDLRDIGHKLKESKAAVVAREGRKQFQMNNSWSLGNSVPVPKNKLRPHENKSTLYQHVNFRLCLWLQLVTDVPVGIWIRDKFKLKIERTVKTPWQEFRVVAGSQWWAPADLQSRLRIWTSSPIRGCLGTCLGSLKLTWKIVVAETSTLLRYLQVVSYYVCYKVGKQYLYSIKFIICYRSRTQLLFGILHFKSAVEFFFSSTLSLIFLTC